MTKKRKNQHCEKVEKRKNGKNEMNKWKNEQK